MRAISRADLLPLAPAAVFLFVLPFPHTVALRLACLFAAAGVAVALWRRLAPPPLPLKLPILLWAGVALGSLSVAVDFPYSLREVKNEVGYTLIAFVTLFALARNERSLRWLSASAAASFVAVSVLALCALAWKGTWRMGAFQAAEGTASQFLVTVAPIAALAAWLTWPSRIRELLIAGAALLLMAVLGSGQRALWPALGVQAGLVCLWHWRTGRARVSARRVLAAALVLVALTGAGLWLSEERRANADPALSFSKDIRPQLWAAIGGRLLEHPLEGAGFGQRTMAKAYPELVPADNVLLWHAHNLVLNYGIYAGIPGMVVIILVFAALFLRFWRIALQPDPPVRHAGLAGAAMVAGVFARNLFNDFFIRDGSLLFWGLAGMLLGYALRSAPAASSSLPTRAVNSGFEKVAR